ncbi:MAG: hypothetical protein FWB75_01385 [Oscillospiraceae bacterium]|nr:hypothetical protein [Oscillospiraceae bacterium]
MLCKNKCRLKHISYAIGILACICIAFVLVGCAGGHGYIQHGGVQHICELKLGYDDERPSLLLVDGVMYIYSPQRSAFEHLSSVYIGRVASQISRSGIPSENFQTNCGVLAAVDARVFRTQSERLLVEHDGLYRVFRAMDMPPPLATVADMIRVGGVDFEQSGNWDFSHNQLDENYVFIGTVQSFTADIPIDDFQANHEVVGARLYKSGSSLIAVLSRECGDVVYISYSAADLLLVDGVMFERTATVDRQRSPGRFGRVYRLPMSVEFANSVHIGYVQSVVSPTKTPRENFEANHDIAHAQIRKTLSGNVVIIILDDYRYSYYRVFTPLAERAPPLYRLGIYDEWPTNLPRRDRAIVVNDMIFSEVGSSNYLLNAVLTDGIMDGTYAFVGEILEVSDIWGGGGLNRNFSANHEIAGARLYKSEESLIVVLCTQWGEFYKRYKLTKW